MYATFSLFYARRPIEIDSGFGVQNFAPEGDENRSRRRGRDRAR